MKETFKDGSLTVTDDKLGHVGISKARGAHQEIASGALHWSKFRCNTNREKQKETRNALRLQIYRLLIFLPN